MKYLPGLLLFISTQLWALSTLTIRGRVPASVDIKVEKEGDKMVVRSTSNLPANSKNHPPKIEFSERNGHSVVTIAQP